MADTVPMAAAIQAFLQECVDEIVAELDGQTVYLDDVMSFEEAGVLTSDQGFVIKLSNAQEFQVTFKRSR
jgi:hypothetical protein